MKKNRSFSIFNRPLHSTYYYLGVFVCLLVSVVLMFLFNHEMELNKEHNANEKLQLIVSDLESNLALYDEIAVKLSLSPNFHPEKLTSNKYNELELLSDFAHYHTASPYTEEIFLFYSEMDYLFRSDGYTTDLEVYLNTFSQKEREALWQALQERQNTDVYLFLSDKLIVLKPVKLYSAQADEFSLLGIVMPKSKLLSRFSMISGGVDGVLEFYCRDTLLFATLSGSGYVTDREPYFAITEDQVFRVSYAPSATYIFQGSAVVSYILLLVAVWAVVMTFANLFTRRAKSKLMSIPNKYRDRISGEQTDDSGDILADIQVMIEQLLENNAVIQKQMQAKQSVIQDQIVYNLLHGDVRDDTPAFFAEHLDFPGPCYYAGCIALPFDADVPEEQYKKLACALADLTNEETNEYIYAIYEYGSALVNFVCSSSEEQKAGMSDYIHEIAASFNENIHVSIGPSCYNLSEISNSWLCSNDLLYAEHASDSMDFANIAHDSNIQHMLVSISEGNSDAAIGSFDAFFDALSEANKSVLLLQKIYIQFANELITLANSHHIELDYQQIHTVITTKEHPQFLMHAHSLIRAVCSQRKRQTGSARSSANTMVLDYIHDHFTDYDISIEKVAQDTGTTPSQVRSVVQQQSGLLYRDYIVHLRLEFAKELLLTTNLNISDVCDKIGYANTSYFVRIFRENTGTTPSKFRQINKGS